MEREVETRGRRQFQIRLNNFINQRANWFQKLFLAIPEGADIKMIGVTLFLLGVPVGILVISGLLETRVFIDSVIVFNIMKFSFFSGLFCLFESVVIFVPRIEIMKNFTRQFIALNPEYAKYSHYKN